jgi:hypothetical protein
MITAFKCFVDFKLSFKERNSTPKWRRDEHNQAVPEDMHQIVSEHLCT